MGREGKNFFPLSILIVMVIPLIKIKIKIRIKSPETTLEKQKAPAQSFD